MLLHSSKAPVFVDENGTRARLAGRVMLVPVAALVLLLLLVGFSLIGGVSLPGLGGPHSHPRVASGDASRRSAPPVAGAAEGPAGSLPTTGASVPPPTGTEARYAPPAPKSSPPVGASASSAVPDALLLGTAVAVSVAPAQTSRRLTPASSAAGIAGTPTQPASTQPASTHPAPTHPTPTHALPTHALPTHASPTHASPTHASPTHASPTHASPTHPTPTHASRTHAAPTQPSPTPTRAHPSSSQAMPTRAAQAW